MTAFDGLTAEAVCLRAVTKLDHLGGQDRLPARAVVPPPTSTAPWRAAKMTACKREWTPSLERMLAAWLRSVLALM